MTRAPLFYVETSVFLAYFADEAGRAPLCKEIFEEARRGDTKIVTSAFTLVEVLRGKSGDQISADVERKIDLFFQHSWINLRQLERVLAIEARRVARKFKLKAGDAIHLATALDSGATKLLTYDSDLLTLDRPGITVSEPKGQLPLAAGTPPHKTTKKKKGR